MCDLHHQELQSFFGLLLTPPPPPPPLPQDQSGLKSKELSSILARVQSKRESFAKGVPDYWRQREEISSSVDQRLGTQRRGSDPAPHSQARSRHSVQGGESTALRPAVLTSSCLYLYLPDVVCVSVLQIRPRSSSLPSRATQPGPAVKQPKTPQPAPRVKTSSPPKTSTPSTKTPPKSLTPK